MKTGEVVVEGVAAEADMHGGRGGYSGGGGGGYQGAGAGEGGANGEDSLSEEGALDGGQGSGMMLIGIPIAGFILT